jgi:hypothetical protein
MAVAVLALLVSLGGNAAAALIITSNGQVAANTISGHKPPAGDHANIVNASINGADVADNSLTAADINEATLTGIAHAIDWVASPSTNPKLTTIATIGYWTVYADCDGEGGSVGAVINIMGPGGAEYGYDESINDANPQSLSGHVTLDESNPRVLLADGVTHLMERQWGTAMLRYRDSVAQVDFNVVSDDLPGVTPRCFAYGTATLGG